jgi:hypothetical protein
VPELPVPELPELELPEPELPAPEFPVPEFPDPEAPAAGVLVLSAVSVPPVDDEPVPLPALDVDTEPDALTTSLLPAETRYSFPAIFTETVPS